jgi:HK97 family phage prohead protease
MSEHERGYLGFFRPRRRETPTYAWLRSRELLNALKQRKHLGSIRTARGYVDALQRCLSDEGCACQLRKDLALAREAAAETLTYRNDQMRVRRHRKPSDDEDGVVMVFDGVITTTKKDRDGDILESAGAVIDPACPLLWQHMPDEPIGKLVKVLSRDDDRIEARFAIVDSELGRDAATLVEFGALRLSHGFMPLEFEAMDDGFRMTSYEILEVSLVSIPSNTDAVITAYRRSKLKHPLMRKWGAGLARRSA